MRKATSRKRRRIWPAERTGSRDAYLMCIHGLVLLKKGERAKGTALLRESLERDPYQNHAFAVEARNLVQG